MVRRCRRERTQPIGQYAPCSRGPKKETEPGKTYTAKGGEASYEPKKMLVVRRLPRERTEPIKLYVTRFDT